MDDKQNGVSDIAEIKKTLVSWLAWAIKDGPEKLSVVDLKETADAIKDLSESEKECYEAEYYKSVVKAMESGNDEPAYLESIRSSRMGYRPMAGMGFPSVYPASGGYGYAADPGYSTGDTRGYMMPEPDPDVDRYGRAFTDYRRARRHYTETHTPADKSEMDMAAKHHMENAITTMREMWSTAEPDLKARMKSDLTKLIQEMNA